MRHYKTSIALYMGKGNFNECFSFFFFYEERKCLLKQGHCNVSVEWQRKQSDLYPSIVNKAAG